MIRLVSRSALLTASLVVLTCATQPAHAAPPLSSSGLRAAAEATANAARVEPMVALSMTAPTTDGGRAAHLDERRRPVDVRWSGKPPSRPQAARRGLTGELLRTATNRDPIVLEDPCPAGTVRSITLLTEGFETGTVPEAGYTTGWRVIKSAKAVQGARVATSTADATGKSPNSLFLPVVMNPTDRTILRFQVRGNYPAETVSVHVNGVGGWLESGDGWGTVTLDVTPVALPSAEYDVRIVHAPRPPAGGARVDVDAVEMYRCSALPATGVRGDVTGDQLSDVLAVDHAGSLWTLPGMRDGALGPRTRAGVGWSSTTWLASPGDLTGDRRPDLLARRQDGSLWRHPGRGDGSFGAPTQVGRGWAGMNALLLPGDISGDGRPDLVARDRGGTLWRYTLGAGGTPSGKVAIGRRFGSLRHLSSPGDLTGDGIGDILGIRADGRMIRYESRRTRLTLTALMGRGWLGLAQLTGPGDVNGDGVGDLLSRSTDGRLSVYLGYRGRLSLRRPAPSPWPELALVG